MARPLDEHQSQDHIDSLQRILNGLAKDLIPAVGEAVELCALRFHQVSCFLKNLDIGFRPSPRPISNSQLVAIPPRDPSIILG